MEMPILEFPKYVNELCKDFDCVLSGRGIYPLLSTIYVRKDSRWDKKFKTKIEIQMEHLTQLCEMGLNFSCVVMDTWYFNKDLTTHIEKMGKDWVAECKSNSCSLKGQMDTFE